MATRYEILRDAVRRRYNLSDTDVGNTVMEELFNTMLKTYSCFRGIRKQKKYTYDGQDITLDAAVHYIITVLWNDTYPSSELLITQPASEEYHYPSLTMIRDIKAAIRRANQVVTEQEFQVYNDSDTKKLALDPVPTTDVFVIYRELFDKDNYPFNDERVIQWLYEAEMLQWCQSTGIVVQIGDIRYDQKRMDSAIEKLQNKAYSHLQPSVIGRS